VLQQQHWPQLADHIIGNVPHVLHTIHNDLDMPLNATKLEWTGKYAEVRVTTKPLNRLFLSIELTISRRSDMVSIVSAELLRPKSDMYSEHQ